MQSQSKFRNGEKMKTNILRIYMPVSAKVKGQLSLWKKIFNSSLANYLLKQAKEFGIEQTVYQRIAGGYLHGKKLVFDQVEVVSDDLPHCVELIDDENKLKSFVERFKGQLDECRVVLFQGATLVKERNEVH